MRANSLVLLPLAARIDLQINHLISRDCFSTVILQGLISGYKHYEKSSNLKYHRTN